MGKILLFGGTTEGRQLAEYCAEWGIPVMVSVATAYGASLLPPAGSIDIRIGRMDAAQMTDVMRQHGVSLVLDATHPYAVEATANIRTACQAVGARYARILRSDRPPHPKGLYFDGIDPLIAYLNRTEGNILLTTGSKELRQFCRITRYQERCAVRVLPSPDIVAECAALGFSEDRILAAKGPFSKEQNMRHLRQYCARCLVTKDSGTAGGFEEKIEAALACSAQPLILKRPQESGISLKDAERLLTIHSDNTF